MNNYTYTYTRRNIFSNKGERRNFFRKIYLSLFCKGCEWEGVGDWTELQHIDHLFYGNNSVSFPFSWAAGGPATLGHGPHSSIFSPTATAQSGVLSSPSAGCWFSLPHLLQLTRPPSYIIVLRPLNSTCRQTRLSPWYLRPDAPVIYTYATVSLEQIICTLLQSFNNFDRILIISK